VAIRCCDLRCATVVFGGSAARRGRTQAARFHTVSMMTIATGGVDVSQRGDAAEVPARAWRSCARRPATRPGRIAGSVTGPKLSSPLMSALRSRGWRGARISRIDRPRELAQLGHQRGARCIGPVQRRSAPAPGATATNFPSSLRLTFPMNGAVSGVGCVWEESCT
jgi:hypothetical protein